MEYKQLNLRNRKKMICKSDIKLQWEDSDMLDILLGALPKMRRQERRLQVCH